MQAALLLGKLGEKAGADALIKALADEDKSVRAMAAQSLGKLGGTAAAPALKALLGREHDSFVATQIKIALSALEDQDVRDRKIFVTIGPFSGREARRRKPARLAADFTQAISAEATQADFQP